MQNMQNMQNLQNLHSTKAQAEFRTQIPLNLSNFIGWKIFASEPEDIYFQVTDTFPLLIKNRKQLGPLKALPFAEIVVCKKNAQAQKFFQIGQSTESRSYCQT